MEYYKLFQKVDGITAMNDFMKTELLKFGCPNDKIDIVRIWAKNDFEKFNRESAETKNNDKVRILSIGRLEEKKGYKYCLKAIAKLKDLGLKVEYNIIGGGNLESELKKSIEKSFPFHLLQILKELKVEMKFYII